jgi:hypothetical protein
MWGREVLWKGSHLEEKGPPQAIRIGRIWSIGRSSEHHSQSNKQSLPWGPLSSHTALVLQMDRGMHVSTHAYWDECSFIEHLLYARHHGRLSVSVITFNP